MPNPNFGGGTRPPFGLSPDLSFQGLPSQGNIPASADTGYPLGNSPFGGQGSFHGPPGQGSFQGQPGKDSFHGITGHTTTFHGGAGYAHDSSDVQQPTSDSWPPYPPVHEDLLQHRTHPSQLLHGKPPNPYLEADSSSSPPAVSWPDSMFQQQKAGASSVWVPDPVGNK